MVAVILAAGKGSRLGQYTTELPKSLLPLNEEGKTLLDYNLQVLKKFDLHKIYVVTGFNSGKIEEHLKGEIITEIIYNPFWNHCNVLGSLYMALNVLQEDFLFLHADTLADSKIWEGFIGLEKDFILPYQRKDCGKEEMKVVLEAGKLVQISKDIDPKEAAGEFLGIAKFSKETISFFKETATVLFKKGNLNYYMESVIQEAINLRQDFTVLPFDIEDKSFVEVDFENDYHLAKKLFGGKV